MRQFEAEDLFKFNHINMDPLTETYNIPFYMQYVLPIVPVFSPLCLLFFAMSGFACLR